MFLSFVTIWVKFVTVWVFEFCHHEDKKREKRKKKEEEKKKTKKVTVFFCYYCQYCHNSHYCHYCHYWHNCQNCRNFHYCHYRRKGTDRSPSALPIGFFFLLYSRICLRPTLLHWAWTFKQTIDLLNLYCLFCNTSPLISFIRVIKI